MGQFGSGPGRPAGVRNKLSGAFLNDLLEDWKTHGKTAIATMRKTDPSGYVRCVAATLPKEFVVEQTTSGLSPEERQEMIAMLRQHIETLQLRERERQQLLIEAQPNGIAN
jgi:hypothetical protein